VKSEMTAELAAAGGSGENIKRSMAAAA